MSWSDLWKYDENMSESPNLINLLARLTVNKGKLFYWANSTKYADEE